MADRVPFIFFGSPPIGPIALRVLEQNDYLPAAIVTDTKLSTEEQIDLVEKHKAGFILVVGYGSILKQALLDSVAGQALNIHPSLLPEYRGPAPVTYTILDGALETGVSLMEIDRKMDHGPILAQERYPLRGTETPSELYEILTHKGTRLFLDHIDEYLSGELEPIPQADDEATYTEFIQKDDGLLDPADEPEETERKVRAYQGWPGTWFEVEGKRLIIHRAHMETGLLKIDEVQPENGKRMPLSAYLAGKRMKEEEFYQRLFPAR